MSGHEISHMLKTADLIFNILHKRTQALVTILNVILHLVVNLNPSVSPRFGDLDVVIEDI